MSDERETALAKHFTSAKNTHEDYNPVPLDMPTDLVDLLSQSDYDHGSRDVATVCRWKLCA